MRSLSVQRTVTYVILLGILGVSSQAVSTRHLAESSWPEEHQRMLAAQLVECQFVLSRCLSSYTARLDWDDVLDRFSVVSKAELMPSGQQ